MTFQKLLREPLVHFLAIGLALFALYALVSPRDTGGDRIVIPAEAIATMRVEHEKVWGRPPTNAELDALVEARVSDEILYREGVAMGLDRDDALIKRRVRQKYDLMAEEDQSAEASDADLESWLKANPESFRVPPVLSFRQIMVPLTGSEADIKTRIDRTASALESGARAEQLAATSLLPGNMLAAPLDLVARDFGGQFAQQLATAPVGKWVGPISSAYGVHFVRIESHTPSVIPQLEDIRPLVEREWENARRTKAREVRLAALRERYDVVIEGLPTKPAP